MGNFREWKALGGETSLEETSGGESTGHWYGDKHSTERSEFQFWISLLLNFNFEIQPHQVEEATTIVFGACIILYRCPQLALLTLSLSNLLKKDVKEPIKLTIEQLQNFYKIKDKLTLNSILHLPDIRSQISDACRIALYKGCILSKPPYTTNLSSG